MSYWVLRVLDVLAKKSRRGLFPVNCAQTFFLSSLVVVFFSSVSIAAHAQESDYPPDAVWVVDIDGAIGPATVDHFTRGLERAVDHSAKFVVLRMDTPGGLDKSMRSIIQSILSSPIPVVTYVAPNGARAASAGTYILYASHVAAMAPATNVGAATPVTIGPGGNTGKEDDDAGGESPADPMKEKMVNDAVAYITSLAELRDRNKEWAEAAVRGAESLSASQALEKNVIDLIADDLDGLLAKLDGHTVETKVGEVTLQTDDVEVVHYEADWRSQFLAVITDPSIAYILLLIGIYGLVLEFYSPGTIGPGVIGAICLLLGMFALQMLPINYVGVALILLGLGLMVAEALVPSFGILGFGGIVAFIIGSVILIDTDIPAFQIALPVILAFAAVSVGFMIIVLGMLLRIRRKTSVSGMESLVGRQAVVEQVYNDEPKVRLEGELWYVQCNEPLQVGDQVEVVGASDVVLEVKKIG